MNNRFTDKGKDIFKKVKRDKLYLYGPLIFISIIIFTAFLSEVFDGFSLFKESKSIFHWAGGLFLFGVLYVLAEAGGTWINKKDSVKDSLYKRFYHLILLLGTFAIFCLGRWLCYKYIWLKI
jgi:hypothetical protein